MSTTIKFTIDRVISPWNYDTNKHVHCASRVALSCKSAKSLPSDGTNPTISNCIFVYRWNNREYEFSHVASPVELLTIPLRSVVTEDEDPKPLWVRDSKVDLLLPSFEIAGEFLDKAEADIYFLAREISTYKQIVGPDELTVEARS